MKRQVRRCVFETNSSSQHSLCIMKKSEHYTPEEISEEFYLYLDEETGERAVWDIWDNDLEFGRSPFRALGTFKDKWLYACASLVRHYNDDTYKELLALALKYVPGLKKIKIPMISDSIADKDDEEHGNTEYFQEYGKTEEELVEYLMKKEKEWGFEVNYWKSSSGYWKYDRPFTGYVDENVLSGFLEKEGITLEEYLTNKKYVVIQDGDEYGYFGDMKRSGLINLDAIDHEYPRAYGTED